MSEHAEMVAVFKGRVQGVGFRATTCSIANELGLKGTVRNRDDGHVEVIAQGSKDVLMTLIQRLKDFYGDGYIQEVDHEFHSIQTHKDRFIITK